MMSARSGYRRILRAATIVFRDDLYAISAAKVKLREEFLKNKHVTDPVQLSELFKGVDEVEEMLRFNIVQGRMNDKGNYEMVLTPENHVTVDAYQHLPHGPELELPDRSLTGEPVHIERVSNKKTKLE